MRGAGGQRVMGDDAESPRPVSEERLADVSEAILDDQQAFIERNFTQLERRNREGVKKP